MTANRRRDEADADGGARRPGVLGRLVWTRALPGSVAVIAALTIPEFSVGAGDLGGAERFDNPPVPHPVAGQGLVKRGPEAGKGALAGVRYGALLAVSGTKPQAAALPRIAETAPGVAGPNETSRTPSQPIEGTPALSPALGQVRAPIAARVSLPSATPAALAEPALATGAPTFATPASADALDAAATYTASVLEGHVAPPGLQAKASFVAGVAAPATHGSTDALDTAVTYAAAVIEGDVVLPALLPAPTGDAAAGSMPALEIGEADVRATELVRPLVQAGLAGEAGLVPPGTIQTPAPAVTASPSVVAEPAVSRPVARPPAASQPAPQAAALAPLPTPAAPAPGLGTPGLGIGSAFALDIRSQLVTRVDGKAAGAVDFQQTSTGLAVRLGSIVEVLGDRYDPAQIDRIRASAASNVYLSLAELQAQGIPISYDPVYDEFNVGQTDTRPKAARKVHMDQVSAPERGLGSTGIDQVRR